MNRVLRWLSVRRERARGRRAARARARTRAKIVAITGSSGKSTTTALLAHVLSGEGRVLLQLKFNSPKAILKAIARTARGYDFAVIEAAASGSGKMDTLAALLAPDVAIATLVALEHKSAFGTADAVAAEKGKLVAAVRPGGIAILNGDDPRVVVMPVPAGARAVRFGCAEGNDYRAVDIRAAFPERLRFTLVWSGASLALRSEFVGEHFWLPVTAAAAAALELGVAPQTVAARVASFEPLLERCGVLEVPNGPCFILDTTKAPWHSIKLAFDVLAPVVAQRKRVVLGHMSDFAGSDAKYRDAYRMARAVADEVIFVGDHAHRGKPSPQDIAEQRYRQFRTAEEVARYIRESAIAGEVILIKGSVDLHLERIALSWRHEVKCWVRACGHNAGCVDCGRFGEPFEWHKGRKRRHRIRRWWRKLKGRVHD